MCAWTLNTGECFSDKRRRAVESSGLTREDIGVEYEDGTQDGPCRICGEDSSVGFYVGTTYAVAYYSAPGCLPDSAMGGYDSAMEAWNAVEDYLDACGVYAGADMVEDLTTPGVVYYDKEWPLSHVEVFREER